MSCCSGPGVSRVSRESETGSKELDWEALGLVVIDLVLYLNSTQVGHP